MQALSATAIHEAPLCRWLFGKSPAFRNLATELRIGPGSRVTFEVSTRELVPSARGPGDIDVLVFDQRAPQHALAIEVKRIRVAPESFDTGLPSGLSELKHGVQQANLLGELGFHRTYLLIAVVTDGRQRSDYNFFGRGPSLELLQIITQFTGRDRLSSGVGLAFVELTQPVDKDVTDAGSTGAWVNRSAQDSEQPATLTGAIAKLSRVSSAFQVLG